MKVYSRALSGAYPSTPTTSQMHAIAAHAVSNASRNARIDYVAQLRGFGDATPSDASNISTGTALLAITGLALSAALWGFAGYGVYKFATRR